MICSSSLVWKSLPYNSSNVFLLLDNLSCAINSLSESSSFVSPNSIQTFCTTKWTIGFVFLLITSSNKVFEILNNSNQILHLFIPPFRKNLRNFDKVLRDFANFCETSQMFARFRQSFARLSFARFNFNI